MRLLIALLLLGAPTVTLDQERLAVGIGDTVTVESRIANPGPGPTGRLVAHLNVASLDGTYVDLEDWSADVTRALPPISAGGARVLTWEVQAVNAGTFAVYVVVLPEDGTPVAGPPLRLTVAGRQTLSAGGALPVIIAVPVLLGLLALAVRRTVG